MCIKLNWVDFDFMLILMLVGINTSTVLLKRNTATNIQRSKQTQLKWMDQCKCYIKFQSSFAQSFHKTMNLFVSLSLFIKHLVGKNISYTLSVLFYALFHQRLVFCSGLRSCLLPSSASKMSYWILHKNKTVLILRAAEVSSVLSAFGDEKRIDKESELKREKIVFCQCSRW